MESKDKATRPDWKVLILRLMTGGYLMYLSYHLITERGPSSGVLYLLVPVLFVVIGLIFCGFAIVKLVKGEFKR